MINFPINVYISCSWKGDLDAEKGAVEELVKDLLMKPVYPQVSSPLDVISNYFSRLKYCDIAVFLLGSQYSVDVENEFRFALHNDIPALVFRKKCESEKKLQDTIEDLYHFVTITPFKTIAELKKKIKASIIDILGTEFRAHSEVEKVIKKLISDGFIKYRPKPTESEYK